MGYKFTLILSRVITDEESAILQEAGCAGAVFGTDSLPTNAEVTVTKMDFDDTASPSLAEAIESGLEAVKKVPDLSVPGLIVPAQPAKAPAEQDAAPMSTDQDEVLEGVVVENGSAQKKPAARKTSARKPATKKASNTKASVASAAASD